MLLLLLLLLWRRRRGGTTGIVVRPPFCPPHPLAVVDGDAEDVAARRSEVVERHDQLVSGPKSAERVAVALGVEVDGLRLLALGDEPSGETVDVRGVGDRDEDVRLVVRVPERPHLHDEAHRATPPPAG